MLDILETYGTVDEYYKDYRVEYALLNATSDYGVVLVGKMMLSKKDALLSLYNILEEDVNEEVHLIESGHH